MLTLLSPSLPLSPSPNVSTSPFFVSAASAFLPCKYVHQYHFSRFQIYMCYYMILISLFLTYFTLCMTGSRFSLKSFCTAGLGSGCLKSVNAIFLQLLSKFTDVLLLFSLPFFPFCGSVSSTVFKRDFRSE